MPPPVGAQHRNLSESSSPTNLCLLTFPPSRWTRSMAWDLTRCDALAYVTGKLHKRTRRNLGDFSDLKVSLNDTTS